MNKELERQIIARRQKLKARRVAINDMLAREKEEEKDKDLEDKQI
jgi:hypothetical protein